MEQIKDNIQTAEDYSHDLNYSYDDDDTNNLRILLTDPHLPAIPQTITYLDTPDLYNLIEAHGYEAIQTVETLIDSTEDHLIKLFKLNMPRDLAMMILTCSFDNSYDLATDEDD